MLHCLDDHTKKNESKLYPNTAKKQNTTLWIEMKWKCFKMQWMGYLHVKLIRYGWSPDFDTSDFEFTSIDRTVNSFWILSPAKIPLQLIATDIQNTLNRICIVYCLLFTFFFVCKFFFYKRFGYSVVDFENAFNFSSVPRMFLKYSIYRVENQSFIHLESLSPWLYQSIVTESKFAQNCCVMRSLRLLH